MRYALFLLLLISQASFAQLNDEQYLLSYKTAVQHYADGNFGEAAQKLIPLTAQNYRNVVTPYALYYFSLASLEEGRAHQARSTLRDLFARFTDWDKIDEAYYAYGIANFKDKYYEEGLQYLDRIVDPELLKYKNAAINSYLPKIENITQLKDLNRKFPSNKVIAQTLVNRIQNRTYNTKADLELSDNLTNRFELNVDKTGSKKDNSKAGSGSNDFDNIIDVGVLLPFDLQNFDVAMAATDKRFVYDLYYGMKKAEAKLKEEQIILRLHGFDVGLETTTLDKYLKDPSFKQLDVVIGPLYAKANRLIENVTKEHDIIQIHPISNNPSLLENSKDRFLIQPSDMAQASAALDLMHNKGSRKTAAIYFGNSRKDSLTAMMYQQMAVKKGYKVLQNSRYIDDKSIRSGIYPGHVFVVSEAITGPKIIRSLGAKKMDSLVIASASSFNLENTPRSIFDKNLYLISPEYVNIEKENIKEFRQQYIKEQHVLPSYYAYIGYDMILFYGRMLKDGHDIFRLNLDESPQMNDLLLSGFDYSGKSQDNKIVPIIKFNEGLFETVNY